MSGRDIVLLVYVEPTPYILGLLRELDPLYQGSMQVWFLMENASQEWNLALPEYCRVIGTNLARFVRDTWQLARKRKLRLIHLGGWGGDARLCVLMFMAWASGVPLFIESDTQKPIEESLWKRWAKRLTYPSLFRVPARFLPGGTRQAEYLKSYGVRDQRIAIARMTVDVAAIMAFAEQFGVEQRRAWRGPQQDPAGRKCGSVRGSPRIAQGPGATLGGDGTAGARGTARSVGPGWDGSMREVINEQASNCRWLVPLGRLDGEELLSAYCAADVLSCVASSLGDW